MTAEHFLSNLRRLYSDAPQLTPLRISKYVDEKRRLATLQEKIGAEIPDSVLKTFLGRNGAFRYDKLNRLSESVRKITERYGIAAFAKLDEKCIRKNGSINEKKLRKRLNGDG